MAGNPPLLLLHAANALTWFLAAIDFPARQAAIPRLVGAERMPAASALNQVLWQVGGIVGPALAASLIGATGPAWAYGVDLLSYAGLLVAAIAMQPLPPEQDPTVERRGRARRSPRASATWAGTG